MLEALINITASIVGLILGVYVLVYGRRALWSTLGIVSLAAAANLLAILVAGADAGRELIELRAWGLVGLAAAIGAFGVVLGRYREDLAVDVVGFIAGANIALWLHELSTYAFSSVANSTEAPATWIGLALLVIGGLLGIWLVRWDQEGALILLSVLIGTELIHDALGLSPSNSFTAVVEISLALAGVLLQYGAYLRERRAGAGLDEPAPLASSLAYFQDLELR